MLILGSNSPRRQQLLTLGGWTFRVVAPVLDETPQPGEEPTEVVMRLATEKAKEVANILNNAVLSPETTIIAADTAVVLEGTILGKPRDAAEAVRMLRLLRGRSHQVFTGVAVYRPVQDLLLTDGCCTEVTMRSYTEAEIARYVASGDPLDKAGGYAIQHVGFQPVERWQGCYANVMGLPLCHLARLLAQVGIPSRNDLPSACQTSLDHHCHIYAEILPSLDSIGTRNAP
jgi:MAF protein